MEKPAERVPIDERIKELEDKGLSKSEIVLKLYDEGYPTQEIMKRRLPLKALKQRRRESAEQDIMAAIQGRVRGEGYLDELKNMIRAQISRSRELTEFFYNVGLGTLLAALRKSGLSVDEFRRIALEEGTLKEALNKAAETAFKAIDYYQTDLVSRIEAERDEARAYASMLEVQMEEIKRNLDPKVRLERMIYNLVLLSGSVKVNPNTLMALVDKWLRLEVVAS